VFAGSVGFEQRDVEDVVDLPFLGQREADSQSENDFLDLERTMIFVVKFPRWAARFDVAAVEHHQVSYLVCWVFFSRRVGIPAYLLLCIFQSFPGFVVYGVHPVGVDLACWVEGFC